MIESIVASISLKVVKDFISYVGKRLLKKNEDNKEYESFLERLSKYLENHYIKHSNIKMFLYGGKPFPFDDVYYPLKIEDYHNKNTVSKIRDVFSDITPKYITITGDAGSGKTTFVKYLFREVLQKKLATPFFIELRSLGKKSIENYILDKLNIKNSDVTKNILIDHFDKGEIIFFLDGYDELENEKKATLLTDFAERYPQNRFIITSRPSAGVNYLDQFTNYDLCKLDKDDIKKFATKQLQQIHDGDGLKAGLLKSLEHGLENKTINTFLYNPLLLSIYMATYKSSPEIPEKKHLFYQTVFDALFFKHDSISKGGFKRRKKTGLDQSDIEQLLRQFSYTTYWKNELKWNKKEVNNLIEKTKSQCGDVKDFKNDDLMEDLVVSIALWTEDEGKYSFSHRSFQEYFTALHIKELSRKEEFYQKLIESLFTNTLKAREIENLLGLLQEIDTEYYEYFYLPLFEKTKEILTDNIESFLSENILLVCPVGTPEPIMNKFRKRISSATEKKIINESKNKMGMKIEVGMRMGMEMVLVNEMGMGEEWHMARALGMEMVMTMEIQQIINSQNLENNDFLRLKSFYDFLTIIVRDQISESIPFIQEHEINYQLWIAGIKAMWKEEKIRTFVEENSKNQKRKIFTYDSLPQEINNILTKAFEKPYLEYKNFIEKEIKRVSSIVKKNEKNSESDLDVFE